MSSETFVSLILDAAQRHPQRCALTGSVDDTSFESLVKQASMIAAQLRSHGTQPGEPVGLLAGRDAGFVVGFIGIELAGAAPVPVSITEPKPRRDLLLRIATVRTVVSAERAGSPVVLRHADGNESPRTDIWIPGSAYVLATSGTTGSPRAVVVPHSALLNYLTWAADTLLDPAAPMPVLSAPSFDAVLKQILAPLIIGAQVLFVDDATVRDPARLAAYLSEGGPYTVNCVPSVWRGVLAEADPERPLRIARLMLGGEASDGELLDQTRHAVPGVDIWNLYGPTETTANASAGRIEDRIHLGISLPGRRVQVLDDRMESVTPGADGQIYLGGNGLATCYLGDPAATADRFVPDPSAEAPGSRMFRTGDLATAGRPLIFRGRADRQLKRLGVRIEPAEVESVLRRLHDVRDAAVVAVNDAGTVTLLAVVEASNIDLDARALRTHAAQWLHSAAVPDRFIVTEELPRTPAGKPDLGAIRAMVHTDAKPLRPTRGDTNPIESRIARIWAEVLGHDEFTIDDDFFAIGGHSIAVVRIAGRLATAVGLELDIEMFYDAPTVAQQAAAIGQRLGDCADGDTARSDIPPRRPLRPEGLEEASDVR